MSDCISLPQIPFSANGELNWIAKEPKLNTAIKNQERCNGCWAIAASTCAGYKYYLDHRVDDFELSAQELIDRVIRYYPKYQNKERDSAGCYTNSFSAAYDYIVDHGLNMERNYPFKAEFTDTGPIRENERPRVKIARYVRLYTKEDVLKHLKVQPLTGGIGITRELQNYDGKTPYKGAEQAQAKRAIAKHAIVIVGINNEEDCFIIRNSWGRAWGCGGYGLIPCHLVSNISVPLPPITVME